MDTQLETDQKIADLNKRVATLEVTVKQLVAATKDHAKAINASNRKAAGPVRR